MSEAGQISQPAKSKRCRELLAPKEAYPMADEREALRDWHRLFGLLLTDPRAEATGLLQRLTERLQPAAVG